MGRFINGAYVRTNQTEYLQELKGKMLAVRADWDLSPSSYDGKILQIFSEALANIDDQIASTLAAFDLETATGQSLRNQAISLGVVPRSATYGTCEVTFRGVDGTLVPKGTVIRNRITGVKWATSEAVVIDGTTTVKTVCTESGEVTAGIAELTDLAVSIANITSVTNDEQAVIGSPIESDNSIRSRCLQAVSGVGVNQLDSIFAEVAKVEGITHLKVYENPYHSSAHIDDQSSTGVNMINPNSIIVFFGGQAEPRAVLEAILRKKNPGCNTNDKNANFGIRYREELETEKRMITRADGVSVEVGGSTVPIAAFEVDPVPVQIKVNIRLNAGAPSTIADDIKRSIIQYANATLFAPQSDLGFDRTGFEVGETVNAGKIFTPVNKILAENGYIDTSVESGVQVGKVGLTLGAMVAIYGHQVATFAEEQIEVVIL